ncbi:MAG: hypothetical protein IPJ45_13455 [Ignavibacteria bacterium]|nr:hypothetical protein [Ignavibacteria bacterium]
MPELQGSVLSTNNGDVWTSVNNGISGNSVGTFAISGTDTIFAGTGVIGSGRDQSLKL